MTDADQHTAFLQAICEAPKDDAPRLMFADWLDEHGEPERAEFIRVGCELAKPCPLGYSDAWHVDGCCPFCDPLKERERELLSEYWEQWSSAVENYYGRVCFNLAGRRLRRDSERWVGVLFRRGFVAAVALPVDAWLQHADALCAACPLEEVRLTTELEFDRDWGFIDSDMCIVYLLAAEPHTEIDVTELPEGFNLIAALLAKRWPRITFHLPEDRHD